MVYKQQGNMMQNSTKPDRRSLERFELKLPIRASNFKTGQSKQALVGISIRDISGNGAFLKSIKTVPTGNRVTLNMTLPVEGFDMLSAEGLTVNLIGDVVRSEQNGFAVRFRETYQILI